MNIKIFALIIIFYFLGLMTGVLAFYIDWKYKLGAFGRKKNPTLKDIFSIK